jgi:hypothetical protein
MNPADELAIGGLCLALPGEAYAFYVEGDSLTANLTGLISGKVKAEWINTWTGEKEKAVARPGVYKLKKPESFGTTPGLLVVRVTSTGVAP